MHHSRYILDRLLDAKPQALVFDMDGTIVDTRNGHMAAWRRLIRKHRFPDRYLMIAETAFGRNNCSIFDLWFGPDRDRPDYDALSREKELYFRQLSQGRVRPRPGFRALLRFAQSQGLRLGIATSGPAENAAFILRELGVIHAFHAVVTSSAVMRSKPAPDSFLAVSSRLGIRPACCLGFEDSPHGIQSVLRAGMLLVAIADQPADIQHNRMWTPLSYHDFRPVLKLMRELYG